MHTYLEQVLVKVAVIDDLEIEGLHLFGPPAAAKHLRRHRCLLLLLLVSTSFPPASLLSPDAPPSRRIGLSCCVAMATALAGCLEDFR